MAQKIVISEQEFNDILNEAILESIDEYGEWAGVKTALGNLRNNYKFNRASGRGVMNSLRDTAGNVGNNYRTGKYNAQLDANPRDYQVLPSDLENYRKQDSANQRWINARRFPMDKNANGENSTKEYDPQSLTNNLRFKRQRAQSALDQRQAERQARQQAQGAGYRQMGLRPTGTDGEAYTVPMEGGQTQPQGRRGMENSPYRNFRDNNRFEKFNGKFGEMKSPRHGKFSGLFRESLDDIIKNAINEELNRQ